MNSFLINMLSNGVIAAFMFAILMIMQKRINNPVIIHLFLLLILVKLITPAYWQPSFAILPSNMFATSSQPPEITDDDSTIEILDSADEKTNTFNTFPENTFPEIDLSNSNNVDSSQAVSLPDDPPGETSQLSEISPERIEKLPEDSGNQLKTESPFTIKSFIKAISILWITGSVSWLFLSVYRITQFRKHFKNAQPLPDDLKKMAVSLGHQIGLKRIPKIQLVSAKVSPMLWTFDFRPRIILPAGLVKELNQNEREILLLHELVHYRRGDHWVRFIEFIATGIYWWYPVLWSVRRVIRDTEEQCCDARVIQTLPEQRRCYAELLVKAISYLSVPVPLTGATGMGSKRHLEKRVTQIMCDSLNGKLSTKMKTGIVAAALILLPFAPMLGETLEQPENANDEKTLPISKEIISAYQNNFRNLLPIEINYNILTSEFPACIDEDRRQLKAAEMVLKLDHTDIKHNGKPIYNKDNFHLFIREFMQRSKRLKSDLKPEAIKKRLAEKLTNRIYFWSDGKSLHRRWPRDVNNKNMSLNSGSVNPPENLNKQYGSINMASWSMDNNPHLRCWFGGGQTNDGQGRVTNDLNDGRYLTSFAPMGIKKTDKTHQSNWYNLDLFMSEDPSHYKVLRRELFNGRPTILVDRFSIPGTTGLRDRIRAWIDPEQGYIPLRLEWAYVDSTGKAIRGLHRHIEVMDIKKVAGGYYPVRIKLQDYVSDSKAIEKHIEKQMQENKLTERPIDLVEPVLPLIPGRTTIWEVTDVTPNKTIEPATLALEFPKGTRYTNAVDDRSYHAGEPSPIPLPQKTIPHLQVGQMAPPLQIANWIDGKSRKLSDFQGKVVVLLFWDISEYPKIPDDMKSHINTMMKWMKKFHTKYSAKGVVFLDIHPAGTNIKKIREFQKFRKWNTLAAIDESTKTNEGKTNKKYSGKDDEFGVFLINRNGRIAFTIDTIEGDSGEDLYYQAAIELSIPLPIDEDVPEEQAVRQSLKIMEFIIDKKIKKALAEGPRENVHNSTKPINVKPDQPQNNANQKQANKIVGQVVTTDGKPVPGITVKAYVKTKAWPEIFTTNAKGEFQVPADWADEEDKEYTRAVLLVRDGQKRLGWHDFTQQVNQKKNRKKRIHFKIVLLPRTHTIKGQFVNEQGIPLQGIRMIVDSLFHKVNRSISYENFNGKDWFNSSASDKNGIFTLTTVEDSNLNLHPDHPDWIRTYVNGNSSKNSLGQIKLSPAAKIEGRVLFETTGKPAVGHIIGAQAINDENLSDPSVSFAYSKTDKDGRYTIGGLPAGPFNIMHFGLPFEQKWTAPAKEAVELMVGKKIIADFQAQKGTRLFGKVIDNKSGKPISKIHVGYYGSARPDSGAGCMMVRTEKDGSFEFFVPPGITKIYVAEGSRRKILDSSRTLKVKATKSHGPVILKAGPATEGVKVVSTWTEKSPVDKPESSVAGPALPAVVSSSPPYKKHYEKVLLLKSPSGKKITKHDVHTVYTGSQSTSMWASGAGKRNPLMFHKDDKNRSAFYVIEAKGFQSVRSPEFQVLKIMPDLEVELQPEVIVPIRGKVVDQSGNAVPDARIRIRKKIYGTETIFPWGLEYMTDSRGQFEIEHVRLGDHIQLHIHKEGTGGAESEWISPKDKQSITLADFILGTPNRKLKGLVRDYGGYSVVDATIKLNGDPSIKTKTDSEGQFQLSGLPNGQLSISIDSPGFPVDIRTARTKKMTQNFYVNRISKEDRKNYQVKITLKTSDGKKVAHSVCYGIPFDGYGRSGMTGNHSTKSFSWNFSDAVRKSKGRPTTVIVVADGFAVSKPLIVPMQKNLPPITVNLKAAKPITLRGRVVDSEGNPIEGVGVGTSLKLTNNCNVEPWKYFNSKIQVPKTDSQGYFEIPDIHFGSQIALYVNKTGYSGTKSEYITIKEPGEFTYPDLTLLPGTARISGRVVDSNGDPVNEAVVNLLDINHPQVLTKPDGSFQFEKVADRKYFIRASAEQGSWGGKVEANNKQLKIKLSHYR